LVNAVPAGSTSPVIPSKGFVNLFAVEYRASNGKPLIQSVSYKVLAFSVSTICPIVIELNFCLVPRTFAPLIFVISCGFAFVS